MTNPLIGQVAQISNSHVRFGVIVFAGDGSLALSVDGALQAARWLQGYVPTYGDNVAFAVIRDALGQSSNLVVGRVDDVPARQPKEGVVTAVTAPVVSVAADGLTLTAKYVGATPVVGDRMALLHYPTGIYALGKVTATVDPTPAAPTMPLPPPGSLGTGVDRFPATDSRTAELGGDWSLKDGRSAIQGTYAGLTYAGSWFYGTGPSTLTGKTVAQFRVYLPARLRIGAYAAPATIHLYAHNATVAEFTDPARLVGPFDVTLPAGWSGGWVTVPNTFAAQVITGGGVGIEGAPYAGFAGRDLDPMSGACEFTWTT